MLALILARNTSHEHIKRTDRSIKLFLSNLDRFQQIFYKQKGVNGQKSVKPIWLTRYNYLSLLNIPQFIKINSPLVNNWEGSLKGEGYLRYVKPKMTNF